MQFSDDSLLTLFAHLKGRTVQQPSSFAFTVLPSTVSHHLRQQLRWMRGSTIRSIWRFRYLPIRGFAYWEHLLSWMNFLLISCAFGMILVLGVLGDLRVTLLMLSFSLLVSYTVGLKYLTVARSDQGLGFQLCTLLMAPAMLAWTAFVLRPLRVLRDPHLPSHRMGHALEGGSPVIKAIAAALVAFALVASTAQARVFGIAGTSAQYRALTSMHPTVRADYVPFGADPVSTLRTDLALKATAMFTWTSVPTLTLSQIAAGDADAYLNRTARALRAYRAPVYIRFDQEFNGNWFPWSGDPTEFVAAWRHIWNVFHAAGANNVRWIWGPDMLTYLTLPQWEAVGAYWPGARYVNVVGPTLVEFAYENNCELACRFGRIDWLRATYHKPVWLPESKVDAAERYAWLMSLRTQLATRPWVQAVVWSETTSRGQDSGETDTGDMNWSLTSDPFARSLLRAAVAAR